MEAPCGIFDTETMEAKFVSPEMYQLLLKCDADHEIDLQLIEEKERKIFEKAEEEGVIRKAGAFDFLRKDQCYKKYPARYRESVHWSVTGTCNLKCRHCFMSAPHAKHGSPSHEEIVDAMDQLAECGVYPSFQLSFDGIGKHDFLRGIPGAEERIRAVAEPAYEAYKKRKE